MKIVNLVIAIWKLVAKYPAVTAGVFNVIILAGAQVGLSLTTAQLTTLAGTVAAVFAVLVHAGVIPVTKVDNVKAGLVPTVPKGVVTRTPVKEDAPAVVTTSGPVVAAVVIPKAEPVHEPDPVPAEPVEAVSEPVSPNPVEPESEPVETPEPVVKVLSAGSRYRNEK